MRCFNCQKFGHTKFSCRSKAACAKCAGSDHSTEDCKNKAKCANCSKNHPAYDKSCPQWKLEKEIITIKTNQNITYPEARKQVFQTQPQPGKSYASAISQNAIIKKSVSTQTTIPNTNQPTNLYSQKVSVSTQSSNPNENTTITQKKLTLTKKVTPTKPLASIPKSIPAQEKPKMTVKTNKKLISSKTGKKESKKWRTITKLTPKDFLKAVQTNANQINDFNDIELSNAFDQLPKRSWVVTL